LLGVKELWQAEMVNIERKSIGARRAGGFVHAFIHLAGIDIK
jgi:hypothetical protein